MSLIGPATKRMADLLVVKSAIERLITAEYAGVKSSRPIDARIFLTPPPSRPPTTRRRPLISMREGVSAISSMFPDVLANSNEDDISLGVDSSDLSHPSFPNPLSPDALDPPLIEPCATNSRVAARTNIRHHRHVGARFRSPPPHDRLTISPECVGKTSVSTR
jgi:hypothetical protein